MIWVTNTNATATTRHRWAIWGEEKSSNIKPLLEDGDRWVVHPPKVWADQDGLGPRNHPTTGVFFLQKGSIQMYECCRPADLWRPNIVVACLPPLNSDAWKDWTRKDMLVQVKAVKWIWMNYLSFPDSHIFFFFLQRVWGWKNTRYGQMEVKIESTPTMWWNWLSRWTLLALLVKTFRCQMWTKKKCWSQRKGVLNNDGSKHEFGTEILCASTQKSSGYNFLPDSMIFCFFTLTWVGWVLNLIRRVVFHELHQIIYRVAVGGDLLCFFYKTSVRDSDLRIAYM